jgi:hypothetical protein
MFLGSLPRSTNVESLFGQRNPLRACLQTGKPILISILTKMMSGAMPPCSLPACKRRDLFAGAWWKINLWRPCLQSARSPMPDFTDEDIKVYLQISQQTSLILQNISLLNQTRRRLDEVNLLLDFSRQLSAMDPDAIVKSLLDSSIRVLQHAHAGAVLIWNPKTETLVPRAASGYADNKSMMEIQLSTG